MRKVLAEILVLLVILPLIVVGCGNTDAPEFDPVTSVSVWTSLGMLK